MDKNVCILVCCHKKDIYATIPPYMPIHVGADLNKVELNMISDNTGVNISNKNATFCELTGLYWAWKNLHNVDVIGLCHYRRYFDFHHVSDFLYPETEISSELFQKVDLSIPQAVIDDVNNGMLIVPQANRCPFSLYNDYCIGHISDDIKVLEDILKQRNDEDILKSYFHVMRQGNKFYPYNMFLMKWKDFDDYCTWLFDVLFELEKRLDISNYNAYQKRIFGFLSERLFNVWVYAHSGKIREKPILWFVNKATSHSIVDKVKFICKVLANDLAVKLVCPKSYSNWRREELPKYLLNGKN